MIKFIDSENISIDKICKRDVFGTKIQGYYNTYGSKFDFFKLWIQLDEMGVQTAAICRIDGEMSITCAENADFEELIFFIKMMGFSSLMCKKEVMDALCLEPQETGNIVEYKEIKETDSSEISSSVDYKEYYGIIKDAKLLGVGEYLPWLSDFSYRVKKGVAYPTVIKEKGETVACASGLFITENGALLGAVATKPSHRKKGYGGKLVKHLGNLMLNQNKKVHLLCKKGSILEFYRQNGFTPIGEWSMAVSEDI